MKRRTLLKNAASASLLTIGATGAATATTGDVDPEELPDDPIVSVVEPETGERVTKPVSQTDVKLSDCCIEEDGCNACGCYCCVC